MANLSPPGTQKAEFRPISFVLDDQATGNGAGNAPKSVDLIIRPEDLTRMSPSSISVQRTLGGAWGDSFGPGIDTLTISGHTGWRRTEGDSDDGLERFQKLNDQVFTNWHERRRVAAMNGLDPNGVKLIFSDALDGFSVVVAPMNFTLRRSKSRPLLAQYQISMSVLDQDIDQLGYLQFTGKGFQNAETLQAAGLDSLTASINRITSMIANARSFLNTSLLGPVKAIMDQTARLYGAVRNAITTASGIAGDLISVAQMTAQAGLNLFRTLAAVASIPAQAKAQLMQVAGAYSNILCVLRNALQQQIYFQDYSTLYGSSNCSSTSGGRPISSLAGVNPFYRVVPTQVQLPVSITSQAQIGLNTLAHSDPVLSPLASADLSAATNAIANGMVVSA